MGPDSCALPSLILFVRWQLLIDLFGAHGSDSCNVSWVGAVHLCCAPFRSRVDVMPFDVSFGCWALSGEDSWVGAFMSGLEG